MTGLPEGVWHLVDGQAREIGGGRMIVVAGPGGDAPDPVDPTPTGKWQLWCSTARDGSNPVRLGGQTIGDPVAVWLSDETGTLTPDGVASVAFSGAMGVRTERTAPLAAAGDVQGVLNLHAASPGGHTVTALVEELSGARVTVEASWTVPQPVKAALHGVYGGAPGLANADNGPERVKKHEAWLRRPVEIVVDFPPLANWSSIEGEAWQLDPWAAEDWQLIWSVPPFPKDQGTMLLASTGAYNSHYTKMAQNLVAKGLGNAIIRPLWEFNGSWFYWDAVTDSTPAQWIAAYKHMVDAVRSVPGGNFTFCWCPTNNKSNMDNPTLAWPGVDYVDYVGLDAYDQSWAPDTYPYPDRNNLTSADAVARQKKAVDYVFDGPQGIHFWRDFAKSKNKPMILAEWGLCDRLNDHHGGLDNPYYIQAMYDFISNPDNNVHSQLYFDYLTYEIDHRILPEATKYPMAAKKYGELFGVGADTVIPDPTPEPDPTPDPVDPTPTPITSTFALWGSESRDGSNPKLLNNATFNNAVAIWVGTTTNGGRYPADAKQALFSGATGDRTENTAPLCARGDDAGGMVLWSAGTGRYTVKCTVVGKDDSRQNLTASFNLEKQGTPTPRPVPVGEDRYEGVPPRRSASTLQSLLNRSSGGTVVIPHGLYEGNFTCTKSRSSFLNLVAEKGAGSVLIKGQVSFNDANHRIRFIGVDMQGRWFCNGGRYIHWWYGHHRNEIHKGYSSKSGGQPNVFHLSSSKGAQDVIIAGADVYNCANDLIAVRKATKVILQGLLTHGSRFGWNRSDIRKWGFHCDAVQSTNTIAKIKILDCWMANEGRLQFAHEFGDQTKQASIYIARSWFQGVKNFAVNVDIKKSQRGPKLRFGKDVRIAPKAGTTDLERVWGNRFGTINSKGGVISGSYSKAKPPGWSTSRSAQEHSPNPAAVWRSKNKFSSWTSFFGSSKSSWSGSEGGSI